MLILSFKITPGNMSDAKQVPYLMRLIYFLASVCADKAYLSRKVCDIITKHGAFPYIALKDYAQASEKLWCVGGSDKGCCGKEGQRTWYA